MAFGPAKSGGLSCDPSHSRAKVRSAVCNLFVSAVQSSLSVFEKIPSTFASHTSPNCELITSATFEFSKFHPVATNRAIIPTNPAATKAANLPQFISRGTVSNAGLIPGSRAGGSYDFGAAISSLLSFPKDNPGSRGVAIVVA
jgi:hypothetical protein